MPVNVVPAYQRIAEHYRQAIESGTLKLGERMPSVRRIQRLHQVSMSTSLQACRHLEDMGWLRAKPRSGYFVQRPSRQLLPAVTEPNPQRCANPKRFSGLHEGVSAFVAQDQTPIRVNLGCAYANADAYPTSALQASYQKALRLWPQAMVQPAPAQGALLFREALARRALDAGMQLAANQVLVTHGCIEALNLALRAVAQPGDTVAIESPAYFGLLQILASLNLLALEIPTSPRTGMSVDALELALRTHKVKAVVVVPNFHNPLGCVMPDSAKAAMVALCEPQGVAIIEDDTYSALYDEPGTTSKALKAWDPTGTVIHCASLTKILAPGMRLGWINGGRWHGRITMLKHANSRPNEALAQLALAQYMGSAAYDRHLARLRQRLKRQREQMQDAIVRHFPAGTALNPPCGGMLLWVELPPACSSQDLYNAALDEGIRIAPGAIFSNSKRFDHFIRLSCGGTFDEATQEAMRRLGYLSSTLAQGAC